MRSATQIDEVVERVRQKLGMKENERFDIIEILSHRVSQHVAGFSFQVSQDSYQSKIEAWFDPDGPKIVVSQEVYDGALSRNPHDVFTLCHELGHLVLGHEGVRYRKQGTDIHAKYNTRVGNEEHEARIFAAAFMAPTSKLHFGISVEELKQRFNFSEPAAQKRKQEFEREWRRKHRIERPLPDNVIDMMEIIKDRY